VFSIRNGKSALPPKPADVKEWMDQQQENEEQKVAAEAPDEGDDKKKKKKTLTYVKEWMDQQHEIMQEIATEAPGEGDNKEKETESDSEKTICRFGTSASIPVKMNKGHYDCKSKFRTSHSS
jgi:hypothetical protein